MQSVVEDVLREENCLKNIFSVLHYLQDQGVCLPSVSAQGIFMWLFILLFFKMKDIFVKSINLNKL